jgi:hypothetical protein
MTDTSYAIVLDVDVTESGGVERVKIRDSIIGDGGIESCIVRALEGMQVPGYIVRRMMASHEVSPRSRGAVGNVLVVGAAVELVPILIVAAGVTFIVAVSLHVGEEVAEAISKKKEEKCMKLLVACLENPNQPEWNREIYGGKKDCGSCHGRCMKEKRGWPDEACPRTNERPN